MRCSIDSRPRSSRSASLRALAQSLQDGDISVDDFMDEVATLFSASSVRSAALGLGQIQDAVLFDKATFTADDHVVFAGREMTKVIDSFREAVKSGQVRADRLLYDRLASVLATSRHVYEEGRRIAAFNSGSNFERRLAGDNCCADCHGHEETGWVLTGSLPSIMDCTCSTKCECVFDFSESYNSPATKSDSLIVAFDGVEAPLGSLLGQVRGLPAHVEAIVRDGVALADDPRNLDLLLDPEFAAETSMKVQSLLFPKDSYDEDKIKSWCKEHEYPCAKIDSGSDSAGFHRVRQFDPGNCQGESRTIEFKKASGIKAVVCPLPAPAAEHSWPSPRASDEVLLVGDEAYFSSAVSEALLEVGHGDLRVLEILSLLPRAPKPEKGWLAINEEACHFTAGAMDQGPCQYRAMTVAFKDEKQGHAPPGGAGEYKGGQFLPKEGAGGSSEDKDKKSDVSDAVKPNKSEEKAKEDAIDAVKQGKSRRSRAREALGIIGSLAGKAGAAVGKAAVVAGGAVGKAAVIGGAAAGHAAAVAGAAAGKGVAAGAVGLGKKIATSEAGKRIGRAAVTAGGAVAGGAKHLAANTTVGRALVEEHKEQGKIWHGHGRAHDLTGPEREQALKKIEDRAKAMKVAHFDNLDAKVKDGLASISEKAEVKMGRLKMWACDVMTSLGKKAKDKIVGDPSPKTDKILDGIKYAYKSGQRVLSTYNALGIAIEKDLKKTYGNITARCIKALTHIAAGVGTFLAAGGLLALGAKGGAIVGGAIGGLAGAAAGAIAGPAASLIVGAKGAAVGAKIGAVIGGAYGAYSGVTKYQKLQHYAMPITASAVDMATSSYAFKAASATATGAKVTAKAAGAGLMGLIRGVQKVGKRVLSGKGAITRDLTPKFSADDDGDESDSPFDDLPDDFDMGQFNDMIWDHADSMGGELGQWYADNPDDSGWLDDAPEEDLTVEISPEDNPWNAMLDAEESFKKNEDAPFTGHDHTLQWRRDVAGAPGQVATAFFADTVKVAEQYEIGPDALAQHFILSSTPRDSFFAPACALGLSSKPTATDMVRAKLLMSALFAAPASAPDTGPHRVGWRGRTYEEAASFLLAAGYADSFVVDFLADPNNPDPLT